jgi:hypothetical protein
MAALKFEGISVATVGPALGHEMFVDDVTLLQAEQAGVAGSPVKVFVDHDESIDSLIGLLNNFRIEEDQLRADLELLSAHPQAEFYAEILSKAPGRVGFSMAFSGKPEELGDRRFARVENLVSVDLVSRPAANKEGVFRAGKEPWTDMPHVSTPADTILDTMHVDFLHPVDIALEGMGNPIESNEAQFDAKAAIEALSAVVSKLEETVSAIAADKSEPAEAEVVAEEVKSEEAAPAPEAAELSALSAKVAELEIALAAKGSEAVSSNGAASEDPVEQFKAASEAKDWKRVAQLFSANKAAILRARNAKNF